MTFKDKVVGKEFLQPETVAEAAKRLLKFEQPLDRDKEHFWTFGLDSRNVVKYVDLVSLGSLNASLVHPREVFRLAVIKAAAQVVFCHNHPSGNPEPSRDDIEINKRLVEAGKILGIEVIDHVIIPNTKNGYTSFKEKSLI